MDTRSPVPQGYSRGLVLGFAVVIAAFITSTVIQTSSFDVREQTVTLLGNALPDVEHLSTARAELRDACAAALSAQPAAARRALARMDAEMKEYSQSDVFPGEAETSKRVKERIDSLREAVEKLDAAPGSVPAEELRVLATRSDDALLSLVQLNLANATRVVAQTDHAWKRSVLAGVVFDATAVVVALLSMFYLRRLLKSYVALSTAHQAALERRAQELEDFSGRVAHDLRNPLSALSVGLATLGRAQHGDPALFEAMVARMRAGLTRCENLIDALLGFALAGAPPLSQEIASVDEVVRGAAEDIRELHEEGLELRVEGEGGARVACARGVLSSLVSNLLQNAVKYIRGSPVRRVSVRVRVLGGDVRVEVEDTGPGVPSRLRGHLFEPFSRVPGTTQPGLGLGLATVRKLATAHGGRVGVDDAPEGGATFWFELPAAPAGAPAELTH